jgi:hypothetical protein
MNLDDNTAPVRSKVSAYISVVCDGMYRRYWATYWWLTIVAQHRPASEQSSASVKDDSWKFERAKRRTSGCTVNIH